MSDIDKIINFIDKVSLELKKYRDKIKQSALKEAPLFTPFEFIRGDELGLSYLIAYLFDPNQNHGQRRLFLDAFLHTNNMLDYLIYDEVEVYTEHTLKDSQRRHDIFLIGKYKRKIEWVISVENKLRYAKDQDNQIVDYLIDLEKYSKKYFIFYLTVNGEQPDDKSIPKNQWERYVSNNNAKCISANDMFLWLSNCFPYAYDVEIFIEQFKKYIKENVMGFAKDDVFELVNNLLINEERLSSTLNIIKIKEKLYSVLMDKLAEQLESKMYLFPDGWELKVNYTGGEWHKKYKEIFFLPPDSNLYIGLGTDNKTFNDWAIGIQFVSQPTEKASKNIKNKCEKLRQEVYSDMRTDGSLWWPFYFWLPEPYLDWEVNEQAWIDIRNGKLADYIVRNVLIIKEYLENINLLEKNS